MAHSKIEKDNITYEELENKYNKQSPDNSRIFVVLIVFLFTIPLSLLYFNRKRYYLEHLIFSFNFISAIVYTLFLILPILLFAIYKALKFLFDFSLSFDINGQVFSFAILALIGFYLIIALRVFYKQNYLITIMKGVLLTISSVVIILGYKFVLFFITMMMI